MSGAGVNDAVFLTVPMLGARVSLLTEWNLDLFCSLVQTEWAPSIGLRANWGNFSRCGVHRHSK